MKTVKSWLLFAAVMIVLWQAASLFVNNSILLPSPLQVLEQMVIQLGQPKLYQGLAATCTRAAAGAILAFVSGFFCAAAAWFSKTAAWFLNRLCVLMQSIPNVAYIILILFWMSRWQAVIAVCFLLLFGVVYQSFYRAMESIARQYRDVLFLYPQPWYRIVSKVFIPALKPVFLSCTSTSISLSFKGAVMAEILASVSEGIGRNMQSARLNLDAAGVIAWVIWLVLAVFVFDWLGQRLVRLFYND